VSTSPPRLDDTAIVWYDFICPFCYVGQHRTRILADAGLTIVELPFQAHPEIPVEGIPAGIRAGAIYDFLAAEAATAGLPLNWPPRLPNSRLALAAAEWVRRNHAHSFAPLHKSIFHAHFVRGEDIGDPETVDTHLGAAGVDPQQFWQAMDDDSAEGAVSAAEAAARANGLTGTPGWLVGGTLIIGLQPPATFEHLAAEVQQKII
jgi:predicted DsbA family dithiol-disulfide isomerase